MSHHAPPVDGRRGRRLRALAIVAGAAVIGAAIVVSVVSVPEPSQPSTPDVAALAGPLAHQKVRWETCEFDEGLAAPLPGADLSNVECATIRVPRDWTSGGGDAAWDLRISRAHNIDPAHADYNTTIIGHPGGPYTSGLSFSSTLQMQTPELRATTNYVSYDQRGLGQSSRVECEYEYDPAEGVVAETRAIGEACSQDPDVATMTTEQAVYDTDFIRHLLGLDSVTFMGYSYGTWLGTWYGALFSENIERMILDSAVDSTRPSLQTLYDVAHEGRDRQFRLHLMNWMARNDAVFGLGTDPEDIWNRYFSATESDDMSATARYAWQSSGAILGFSSGVVYPISGSLVGALIAEGESGVAGAPEAAAGRVIEKLGLPEPQLSSARATLASLANPAIPDTIDGTTTGVYSEVIDFTKCTDGQWEQGLEYWEDFNERTARVAPLSAQLGLLESPQACAFWPTDSSMPEIGDDFPQTILLQSELDSMTPFEQGFRAAMSLPHTSLIAVDNESRHGVFPYGTETVDAPVIAFLLGGERPSQTIVAPGLPLPFEESTFESWTELAPNGEHSGDEPLFTDPLVPAETAEPAADSTTD